jgi:hypothetical protein
LDVQLSTTMQGISANLLSLVGLQMLQGVVMVILEGDVFLLQIIFVNDVRNLGIFCKIVQQMFALSVVVKDT